MTSTGIPETWSHVLLDGSPLVCGIVNVTPDSFSDGNQYVTRQSCDQHVELLSRDGAHIIDVGAESTRPGAREVSSSDELIRLNNMFDVLEHNSYPQLFSIDTRHSATARRAIENGFHIINDVSGATFDPDMVDVMADTNALCIVMHMRGTPQTMMEMTDYDNVVDDVTNELEVLVDAVVKGGVRREKIMIDPGIGFSKNAQDNVTLIREADRIKERLSLPIMVGLSRKSVLSFMLGVAHPAPVVDRDALTAQLSVELAEAGIDAIRVHDVAGSVRALAERKQ